MADINQITSGASYTGNAGLGGYAPSAIEIDIKPIQQLAQYTFLYNKSLFDQRQKDADEKIKQLADYTVYDTVNGRGKDKQAVIDAQAELHKWMADFAAKGTPKTPKEKIDSNLEFQSKVQGALKIINGAHTRDIGYTAQKNAIDNDATLSASQKDNLIKDLDKQFDESDIYTPINALPKFDLTIPPIAPPIYKKTSVLIQAPNGMVDQTLQLFDPKSNMSAAFLQANDLELPTLPDNATELQKQEFKQKMLVKSGNQIWQQSAQILNTAVADPKYKNTDGTINYDAIQADNPILHNTLALIDRYNAYATDRKADAEAGFYTDKVGHKVQLLQTVNPDDFFTIDKTKPLSAAQIVFLQKFATAAPDLKEEKYQYSGDATHLQLKRIEENNANYRAKLTQDGETLRAMLKGGPKTVIDEATAFTQDLFTRIAAATDQNGNVDLAKAKITPTEWQMMGKGNIFEGKFAITETIKAGTPIKFDKETNTIVIPAGTKKSADGKTEIPTEQSYIKFQDVGNNKFNFNKTVTAGGEDANRNQLTVGYNTNTSAAVVPEATIDEWKAAGWKDAEIADAVKQGKIKIKK